MEKALSFLSRHKDVAFATVEENKPKIRVFQIMKREKKQHFILQQLPTKKFISNCKKILLWNYLQWLEIFQ